MLIDAGLSCREILARLAAIGERIEDLTAILISHEHCDHVSGLLPLIRKYRKCTNRDIPVYLTHFTAPTIAWGETEPDVRRFQAGERLSIGCVEVDSFTIPHDAIDPVGFLVKASGVRVGVVTDLGYMPDSIRMHLRGADCLVLESNHDIEMLKVGPYPWSVKQRVMGRRGHLSNDVVCSFIREDLDSTLHRLVLGHISEQNNHPEIVRMMADQALASRNLHAQLYVAQPGRQSEVFTY